MPRLDQEIAGWLATLVANSDAPLDQTLRATIVPAAGPDTAGRRALALLRSLARDQARDEAQLVLGDTLGEGGMGIVHLAEQVALGRQVAVKALRPDKKSDTATMDLLREAWVTGGLEHPNVVPVYDIRLDTDGSPLVVLKRIEGVVWSQLMHDPEAIRERFAHDDPLGWNLGILLQVLDAIRFAHSRSIIHRDLKPDNVMIGEFGEVYVVDWGIAISLVDDGSGRLPLAKSDDDIAGTPCYMAPEMLGGPPLSERTDIYLAGSILFEILSGHPPHLGDSALAVVNSVVASDPTPPADAPGELVRICRRATAAEPDRRYPGVDQLQLALRGYLAHRGSERLAVEAEHRLEELAAALDTTVTTTIDGARREPLYRLLGECRFGFREALSTWPDNAAARAGIQRATTLMVEYELAHDHPRAAANLLAELDPAPAELRRKVDAARGRLEADRRRRAELERLDADLDLRTGTRTRSFTTAILGLCFTGFPLLGLLYPTRWQSYPNMVRYGGVLLLLLFGIGVWARDSLSKTMVNRRVYATIVLAVLVHVLHNIGAHMLGADPVTSHVMSILFWFCFAAMASVTIDRRLVPCAAGYLLAFLIAARWPELRLWAMSAANLGFTVNAVVIWRPESWRYTDQERAQRGLPPRR